MAVEIERIDRATPEVAEAFTRLMPQLSPVLRIPSQEELQEVVGSGNAALFCARYEGRIVGVLSLAWYTVPSGCKAWIEDVVVDATARGCGAGQALVSAALDCAREVGAVKIQLTSNAARKAAHALYHKVGFDVAETLVFVLKTEK